MGIKTIGSLLLLGVMVFLLVNLVLAAFSNTRRRLGSNTEFQNTTVAGGMTLGSSSTDGSIRLKTSASPPTCNSGAEGTLYANTTDHIVYLCNGTSWSSI
ncbi:MAG: hypothetical protein U1C49_02395 [Candidatus Andersenbacteria bacterium]|nr:hypothetical protein [Candidatus Andersenbacteria bacterium]